MMAKIFSRIKPSLFEDLVAAKTISMESSESYSLILHLDNKTYYFDHGTGSLDGVSLDGPERPTDWEDCDG